MHTFGVKIVWAVEKFTALMKEFVKHVGSTYRHGLDLQAEIRKMEPYDMTKYVPMEPKLFLPDGTVMFDETKGKTKWFDEETYKWKLKLYDDREETLASN